MTTGFVSLSEAELDEMDACAECLEKGFHPAHFASMFCMSGGRKRDHDGGDPRTQRPHCTCDSCF